MPKAEVEITLLLLINWLVSRGRKIRISEGNGCSFVHTCSWDQRYYLCWMVQKIMLHFLSYKNSYELQKFTFRCGRTMIYTTIGAFSTNSCMVNLQQLKKFNTLDTHVTQWGIGTPDRCWWLRNMSDSDRANSRPARPGLAAPWRASCPCPSSNSTARSPHSIRLHVLHLLGSWKRLMPFPP